MSHPFGPLYVLFFFLAFIVGMLVTDDQLANSSSNNKVEITAHNSYWFDVGLEVKCDWKHKVKKWKYHRFFLLPGKKHITIEVPKNVHKCQIWSKLGRF